MAGSPTAASGTDAVLLAAGDIAHCERQDDAATAKILDEHPDATVATLGDNAYPNGSRTDFAECYEPTWGPYRHRTRPAPGNHEYLTRGAGGYFDYFDEAAGPDERGYYSYELGSWHVVSLNSNCSKIDCERGSAQERWLRADLAAHPNRCTLAYWHHPLYTSSAEHDPDPRVAPLFQALLDHGAEVVLTGHNHHYERFAPMDAAGNLDRARGIRQFVVGTGGARLYDFGAPQPHSEARAMAHGVLKLTLRAGGYSWEFLPVEGEKFTDGGEGRCH